MKNTLKIFALALLAASSAFALDDYYGGDLTVLASFPAGRRATISQETTAGTVIDYSNVTTFLGSTVLNGGAANQAGNTITRLTADDCTPTGANGGNDVLQFKFSVVNLNTVAVTFRPRARFWNDNAGVPGTYYSNPAAVGFTFNPITQNASSATVYTATLAANQMKMPTTTMWCGITFDNNTGGTGATAAQLNNLGQGLFDPPTVGSSDDVIFTTTAAGSFFNVANPAGATSNFMGNPVANFGWEFSADVVVGAESKEWSAIKSLYR